MKTKIIFITLIVTLLLFNILLIVRYKQTEKRSISIENVKNDDSSTMIEKLTEKQFLQQLSEGIFFDSDNTPSMHSLYSDLPVLCFRFKETHCDACISTIIRHLSSMKEHFPSNGIVILSGYSNMRQFNAFAQTQKKTFNVLNANRLLIPLDEQSDPYFFVLTKDEKVQNVFIPDEKDSKYTKRYLDLVRDKYWE